MKSKFKFLSVILATLMLVSFIPLAAFAEEIETGAENTENDTAETLEMLLRMLAEKGEDETFKFIRQMDKKA